MRQNDWPEQLAACVKEAMHKPFEWGQHDCALFACDVIFAMTDFDPGESIRATYATADEAKAVLNAQGFDSLYQFASRIASEQHYPIIPFVLAQRGDIAICHTGNADWPQTLAVCMEGKIFAPGKNRLVHLPTVTVLTTWRI